MNKDSQILVTGTNGLVSSALIKKLEEEGYENVRSTSRRNEDLRNPVHAGMIFNIIKPEYVFLCAAKVGGIKANNDYPAEFFYDNIMIQTNVINNAHKHGVKKLMFLGSSCIYPKDSQQPIKEEYLMTGPLEETNSGYATAKIAGIEMCKDYRRQYGDNFISVMPTNLYGPNDNFSKENSHVLPAMIRKFHEAKVNNDDEVELWGTGQPRREFLHTEDLADGLIFLMNNYDESEHINIGFGSDISIESLAQIVKSIVGYEGNVWFNTNYPDGTYRKLLDITKINDLGWHPMIGITAGVENTYEWFLENYENLRK